MNKKLDQSLHSLLYLGLVVSGFAIWGLRFNPDQQFLVIILAGVFYLLWGLVYHNVKRDLCIKIFLEYLIISAIAALAGILVFKI